MPFGVLTLVADIIIPVEFYVDSLTGFLEAAPPKVTFPIIIGTTVTTVLHYRVDCEDSRELDHSSKGCGMLTLSSPVV